MLSQDAADDRLLDLCKMAALIKKGGNSWRTRTLDLSPRHSGDSDRMITSVLNVITADI